MLIIQRKYLLMLMVKNHSYSTAMKSWSSLIPRKTGDSTVWADDRSLGISCQGMWLVECTPKTRNTSAERWIVKQVELAKQVTSWWDKRCMTVESGFLDTGKSSCVNQHCLLNIFPFLLSNPPLTKDAETNGGQQICWQGLDGRKKHVCPPGKSLLNTAVGLSRAFPLSTHQREPIPPPSLPPSPTPPSPVDRGFSFSHCHSSNLSTDLLSSVDLVAPKCSSGNVCQGSVDCLMVLALASKPTQLPRSALLPRSLQKWAEHVTQIWAVTKISEVMKKP